MQTCYALIRVIGPPTRLPHLLWGCSQAVIRVLTFLVFCALGINASFGAATPSFVDFDRRAKAGERLTVVFFGTSSSWGVNASDPPLTSWRGLIMQRLDAEYPRARFKFRDAGMGGTGPVVGAFRLERDVLRHNPDLVFVDFSMSEGFNDGNSDLLAAYEAIIRRIIQDARAPVVQLVLPMMIDVVRGNTDGMRRRDAAYDITRRYHAPTGDAVLLCLDMVKHGRATVPQLWPFDATHPGDKGYELFADAAWRAYMEAIQAKRVCLIPQKMRYAETYMACARVRFSALGPPPVGWRVGLPNPISPYFDMLMSRWLDDEVIATNKREITASDGKRVRITTNAAPFQVRFSGSCVMLLGESTPSSVNYRVYLDGTLVEHKASSDNQVVYEFDGGALGKAIKGNGHHAQLIADKLDEAGDHVLQIYPIFFGDAEQELRLESICVAGGKAVVYSQKTR